MRASARVILLGAACALALAPPPSAAQTSGLQRDLRDSQLKLDSIKAEQQRLTREMAALQTRVRDASRELLNIERQKQTSTSALLELEFQTQLLADNVLTTSRNLDATQTRLQERKLQLQQRLRAIYKRGALHAVEVLLSARDFADLLNRYKYLHLIALYDRMMVEDVTRLEQQLVATGQELRQSLQHLDLLREEKAMELAELQRTERQRQGALTRFRQQEEQTASRSDALAREQQELTNVIANLERLRREEEARNAGTAAPASISTRDLGSLDWPLDGTVLYRFGPERQANGVVLKNQGIGLGAPGGTVVAAVESGVIEWAGPYPGYGATVIVSHGGGYRTLYLYLDRVSVQLDQRVDKGAPLGTIGGGPATSAHGPHMEFQVRVPMDGGITEAVDPLAWLRGRSH